MVEISLVKLCCVVIAAMMGAATFGFLLAAILANSKRIDLQADETFRKLG